MSGWARTRLDALRQLRDEGYAVVDRDGYEAQRAENQRLRSTLEAVRENVLQLRQGFEAAGINGTLLTENIAEIERLLVAHFTESRSS